MACRPTAGAIAPGENLGQGIYQAAGFFTPATSLLEGQQVHPAMQKTPVVGKLGLDQVRQIAAGPEIVEWQVRHIGQEFGLSNLVNPTPLGLSGYGVHDY